ncbi:hypothetical protein CNR22_16000 [Sphingobacteriaceae bacterium]|nr:hypothetical protein CNR22_16000 [Sphingobacteriaceae bacterium]
MYLAIQNYCEELTKKFGTISQDRKKLLQQISRYVISKQKENKQINLVYICTHNSRRSHFGQIWSKVTSDYYGIMNVNTFSGGTEANRKKSFWKAYFQSNKLFVGMQIKSYSILGK